MKYFRETGVYKSIRKHMKQEKDILKGLRAKREDAQCLLLKQYGGMVFSQIVRIVPSREDAEEVYQDVFIKAFRHIESYDEQRASLSTWLMRIAYHEALNFMRGMNVRKIPIEDDVPEIANVPDDEMDGFFGKTDEETIGLIEQALERLSFYEQSLVSMYYYEELSIKEIAYVTDSVPATIATKLFRVRQKLYHIILDIRNEGG